MPKQYQARVEAIQRRKADNKAAKDVRDSGRAPDQILSKILSIDPDAEVLLLAQDYVKGTKDTRAESRQRLCRSHFCTEECALKRCKWSHEISIAHVEGAADLPLEGGAQAAGSAVASMTVPAMDRYVGVMERLWPKARRGGGGGGAQAVLRAGHGRTAAAAAAAAAASAAGGAAALEEAAAGVSLGALPEPLLHAVLGCLAPSDPASACAAAACCRALFAAQLSCEQVEAAKRAAVPRLQAQRNRLLIRHAARVRYIASAAAPFARARASGGKPGKQRGGSRRRGGGGAAEEGAATALPARAAKPMLVHDSADMAVYDGTEERAAAFFAREAAVRSPGGAEDEQKEGGGGGGGGGASAEEGGGGAAAAAAGRAAGPPGVDRVTPLEEGLMSLIFSWCDDRGACGLVCACQALRTASRADPAMRGRRREGMAAAAAAAAKSRKKVKKKKKMEKSSAQSKSKDGFSGIGSTSRH
jgi:hypothetical protein